jgi:hypothetical protein
MGVVELTGAQAGTLVVRTEHGEALVALAVYTAPRAFATGVTCDAVPPLITGFC